MTGRIAHHLGVDETREDILLHNFRWMWFEQGREEWHDHCEQQLCRA